MVKMKKVNAKKKREITADLAKDEYRNGIIREIWASSQGRKLSEDERAVISRWLFGEPRWKAWANVMRPNTRITEDTKNSISVQANRFWSSERVLIVIHELIKRDVIPRDYVNDSKSYRMFEKRFILDPEECEKTARAVINFSDKMSDQAIDDVVDGKRKEVEKERLKRNFEDQRRAWLESFKDIENPTATTAYGIGLWLAVEVIQQVNKKKAWIEKYRLNPLEASPYSSADISAVKAVLSALLPFAPAPTDSERKAMTMASVIVGLTADDMGIDPDKYTAPIPAGSKNVIQQQDVDVSQDIEVDENS